MADPALIIHDTVDSKSLEGPESVKASFATMRKVQTCCCSWLCQTLFESEAKPDMLHLNADDAYVTRMVIKSAPVEPVFRPSCERNVGKTNVTLFLSNIAVGAHNTPSCSAICHGRRVCPWAQRHRISIRRDRHTQFSRQTILGS